MMTVERRAELEFDDQRLLPVLLGEHDKHLDYLATRLGVHVSHKGNGITLSGGRKLVEAAQSVLLQQWQMLKRGEKVSENTFEVALRQAEDHPKRQPHDPNGQAQLKTRKGLITPRTKMQGEYLEALQKHDVVFALGPAGTGKTYLAVAQAVAMMQSGQVDKLILTRPAVEAGERLGFLPGDLREKIDPYLRPLYDALHDMMPADQVERRLERGEIEIAPLAFMRGRTLSHAFVILDEAQNTMPVQMKMFLTRLGEGSRMVITGDLSQVDLPYGQTSGLHEAERILDPTPGISFVRFTEVDVVRHPMVAKIVTAYQKADQKKAAVKAKRDDA